MLLLTSILPFDVAAFLSAIMCIKEDVHDLCGSAVLGLWFLTPFPASP